MRKHFILEIKVDNIISNKKDHSRMSCPVLHTWKWQQMVICECKKTLQEYAEKLSLDLFYWRKREYQII